MGGISVQGWFVLLFGTPFCVILEGNQRDNQSFAACAALKKSKSICPMPFLCNMPRGGLQFFAQEDDLSEYSYLRRVSLVCPFFMVAAWPPQLGAPEPRQWIGFLVGSLQEEPGRFPFELRAINRIAVLFPLNRKFSPCGCGSKPMVPECTTHFRTYFSGWIAMFTGG